MRTVDQPQVIERDGWWTVECRECRLDRTNSLPIGIGLTVATKAVAQMLAENHRGRRATVEVPSPGADARGVRHSPAEVGGQTAATVTRFAESRLGRCRFAYSFAF